MVKRTEEPRENGSAYAKLRAEYLGIKEVAKILDCSPQHVVNLCKREHLRFKPVPIGKTRTKRFVLAASVKAYLDALPTKGGDLVSACAGCESTQSPEQDGQ